MHVLTKTVVLIGGALLAAGAAVPAEAAPRRGSTCAEPTSARSSSTTPEPPAHGPGDGIPFDGTYTAVLAAADGGLPEPGVCEPATATLDVTGSKHGYLRLAATGEVCGTWPDATYVVTHNFVGRYDVVDGSVRKTRGTDGWISLILATEGRANVEAIDT